MNTTFNTIRGIFDTHADRTWPHRWTATVHLRTIAGGIPTDPKVAEAWIRTKLGADTDDMIRELAAQTMIERGETDLSTVATEVNVKRHSKGFKRDDGWPYIEGRQIKAMIKESANILWPKRQWGPSKKGTKGWWAEHVHVVDDTVRLVDTGHLQPDPEIIQTFVHTFRGSGIQYTEVCRDVEATFTVVADNELADEWPALWNCAQMQGLGADRSADHGRFKLIRWDPS